MRTACCSGFGGSSSVSRAPRTSGGAASIWRARASRDAPRRGTLGGYRISPTSSRAKRTPTSASARDGGRAASPGRWRSPRFTPTPIRSRRAARTPRCARPGLVTSWRCESGSCRTRPCGRRPIRRERCSNSSRAPTRPPPTGAGGIAPGSSGRNRLSISPHAVRRHGNPQRRRRDAWLFGSSRVFPGYHGGGAARPGAPPAWGGGVALQTAIRHPEVVRKLVLVSTPFRRDGFYPEILAQQGQVGPAAAEAMKQTPMYQLYASLAPRPEDWPRLLGKIGEAMKQDFDFSKDIGGITATTLVVAGDADIFPPAHAVELFGLLGGGKRDGGWDGSGRPKSRLAILPGQAPVTLFRTPGLAATVIPFLHQPTQQG